MKIAVHMTFWQRAKIAKQAVASIRAIETAHELFICGAISPDDPEASVLASLPDEVVTVKNRPLSNKHNALLAWMANFDFDYVWIMGSDDIVSKNFLDNYEQALADEVDAYGLEDFYFHEAGQTFYFPGYGERRPESLGAARMISRRVLEAFDWQLWPNNLDRGLDGGMTARMKKKGFAIPYAAMREGTCIVDVKSSVSISAMSDYLSRGMIEQCETPKSVRNYLSGL